MVFQTEYHVLDLLDWTLNPGQTLQEALEESARYKIEDDNPHFNFNFIEVEKNPSFAVEEDYLIIVFRAEVVR